MIRHRFGAWAIVLVASIAAQARAADIAVYNLDESSGTTAADSAGVAQNGVLMNFGITPSAWRSAGGVDGGGALSFNGVNQYVQLEGGTTGNANTSLGLSNFTLSAYVRVLSPLNADVVSTGGNGLAAAIPIVTKGRGEADGSNLDANYFLGVNQGPVQIVADYEEGPGGAGPTGNNHPVTGAGVVARGVWQHVAATFDGTSLKVFRNGVLDATINTPNPLRSDSIQLAAIGSALQSNGTADGAFRGLIDNVRINNAALTDAQVSNLASALTALNTTSFQEGAAGYAGTQDTHVRADNVGTSFGGDAVILADGDTTGGQPSQALVRFDNLFGGGPGQIPLGSTIVGATLTLSTTDGSAATMNLHEMLQTWTETATFTSLGSGVSADNVEAKSSILDSFIPTTAGQPMDFDVTASLQAWLTNPSQNFGWVILPTGTDGYQFASSENGTSGLRPLLTVQYLTAAVPEPSSWLLFAMMGVVTVGSIGWRQRRRPSSHSA
jgi:hypothetical protein